MALKNAKAKANKEQEALKIDTLEVKRATTFNSGAVGFDCIVNGITIYGCVYRTYEDRETGEETPFIAFPSRKGNDGKYYNHVWFKIAPEDIARFEEAIDEKLK